MVPVAENTGRPELSGVVERVTTVIDEVARRGEVGIRELAIEVGMSRSAVHRVVQVLSRHRVVHALPSGRYVVGARLISWAHVLAKHDPLLATAEDVLGRGAAITRETAYLCGYREGTGTAVVLGVWPGSRPLRYELVVGSTRPMHVGAAGKAILSELNAQLQRGADVPSEGALLLGDPALRAELEATHERGFSKSVGELNPEAAGVGSPVVDRWHVIGAVGFTLPRQRLNEQTLENLGALAHVAAQQINHALADNARLDLWQLVAASQPGRDRATADGRDVTRVVEALDAVARAGGGGVEPAVLAAELGASKATVAAMLDRLESLSVLREKAVGRYLPGVTMLSWPGRLPEHGVADVARDLITDAVGSVGETVSLVVLDSAAAKVRYVLTEPSSHQVRFVVAPGLTAALHAGAAGKAVLAYLNAGGSPSDDAELAAYTDRTITSPEALRTELDQIASTGYAVSIDESVTGATGVATPYFVDGDVAGAVVTTMPSERFKPENLAGFVEPLLECSAELTSLLSACGRRAGE